MKLTIKLPLTAQGAERKRKRPDERQNPEAAPADGPHKKARPAPEVAQRPLQGTPGSAGPRKLLIKPFGAGLQREGSSVSVNNQTSTPQTVLKQV